MSATASAATSAAPPSGGPGLGLRPPTMPSSRHHKLPLSLSGTLPLLKASTPAFAAAAAQSASLMWLSTTAAVQYRSGLGTWDAIRTLYAQGGVTRFYSGAVPTITHVALCRFGDTASNHVALHHVHASIPVATLCASLAAASWRVCLLPLETLRANRQVNGPSWPYHALLRRIRTKGLVHGLYGGAFASFSAGVLGHFPFFCTVNLIESSIVRRDDTPVLHRVATNGGMGFVAAMSSDIFTNSFKVFATVKQTSRTRVSYSDVARSIVRADGVAALLTRGLRTRLIANGLQGATFVLLWKEIDLRRQAASHTIVP